MSAPHPPMLDGIELLQSLAESIGKADLAKMAFETNVVLADLVTRCKELDVCLRDPIANGYDGATTRTVWRQSLERAESYLKRNGATDA